MDQRTPKHPDQRRMNRRDILRATGAVGLAAIASHCRGASSAPQTIASGALFSASPIDPVRVGFVGVGGMGSVHVRNLLKIDGVQFKAVCDIVPEKAERVRQWCREAGRPEPDAYTRGETDFERLCLRDDLDLVFTATPWRWHVPVCLSAMTNGKHAATEVPAALSVDECWRLVETAESEGRHCVMMENCNYDRREMMILNMVRQGLLGEVLHAECGYLHDLRAIKFSAEGEGLWRRAHSMTRNGNLYPTHGLGPVAQCMDINRGDRFDYLVSMSSPSRGLQEYARRNFLSGSPQRQEEFVLGDVNVTLIKTVKGRTIFLSHDTNLPRPYSRINSVQGSRGLVQGYPDRVHIEGRSPSHRWQDASEYYPEFEHPLWKTLGDKGDGAGHGGMDFIEDYRLIQCLRRGRPMDMDVYDAAALSCICELTERSVAQGSQPQEFPDFTRGAWATRPALGIVQAEES